MDRRNLMYLIALIIGIIASILFIFVPIINIMMQFNTHPIWFILVVCVIIPLVSVGLIYLLLDLVRTITRESREEELKEVVGGSGVSKTEREVLADLEFENKKTIIYGALKQISELKETTIIYFEEIADGTGYDEGEIEDFVVLLIADGVMDGDVYFDEDDKGCVKLKSPQFKVKYDKKSKK